MTDATRFTPLVGRTNELRELHHILVEGHAPVLIVAGPSGIGKTVIADTFASNVRLGTDAFQRVWFHSLYRVSWTSVLADIRRQLEWAPRNATVEEIETRIIDSCQSTPTLVVLDNADADNVNELAEFVARWQAQPLASSLLITAQTPVAAQLPDSLPTLALEGIQSDAAILDLCGDLADKFPERTVLEVGRLVEGNPQRLLFLSWIQPDLEEELKEYAANLQQAENNFVIEEFIENTHVPALFFIALGIHRSFIVSDKLLAFLWDNLGSGAADAYVRVRENLIQKRIIVPIGEYVFRLHETVHVQLEKALIHRVGLAGVPYFHRFFAEFYEKALSQEITTTNLTHFIYHSLSAKDYTLALRTSVQGPAAQALATRGAAVLVRQELEKLDTRECLEDASPLDEVRLCLRLGGMCNDLSDHEATLAYMDRSTRLLRDVGREKGALERQVWYYSAVSYSNIGQSDRCLQEYFKIVDSCTEWEDDLACLSLAYLAHDLKYRDLAMALELGELTIDWAARYHAEQMLAKNMCSYAESLTIAGRLDEAISMFREAIVLAEAQNNVRELGRIETNLGFALTLVKDANAISFLEKGRDHSSAMGDRRRLTQAILYTGVFYYVDGQADEGVRLMRQAAELLRMLQDGRYFIPALCWILQARDYPPKEYPTLADERAAAILYEMEASQLLDYANARPELVVYHNFWWRYLSTTLR